MPLNPFHKETPEETERRIERYRYAKEQRAIREETRQRQLAKYKQQRAEQERSQQEEAELRELRPKSTKRRLLEFGIKGTEALIRARREQARKRRVSGYKPLNRDKMRLSEREPKRRSKRSKNPYPNLAKYM